MTKVFLDTNILLDVFLARKPYVKTAQEVWTLCERKKILGAISAISVNNIFFIIKKLSTVEKAYSSVEVLLDFFKIVQVSRRSLLKAYHQMFSDFEDAIQYQAALEFGAQVLLTRNPVDFKKSEIPIMDLASFLTRFHIDL